MKITEPGVYDLSMEDYHSDLCAGPSISSSGLRTIHLECPLEYWAFSYLNPDRFPKEEKAAFSFGRAAHCLLLGGEDFESRYAVRPAEFDSWRTKASKEWRDAALADGRTVIEPDDLVHIAGMAKMLERLPIAETLLSGQVEKSLVWQDEETGIWLKARPDVIPAFDNVVADYKTTVSRVKPYQLQQDISTYGYHMQMALIAEGMERLLDQRDYNHALVFQSKRPPYHCTTVEISPEYLDVGRQQNRRALRTFARCLETGEWPGYTDGIPVAHPPEWMVKELETTTGGE